MVLALLAATLLVACSNVLPTDPDFPVHTLATLRNAGTVSGLAFSPDGRYVTGVVGDKYVVWDAAKGGEVARLGAPYAGRWRKAPAFTPDSKRILVQPGYPVARVGTQMVALALWEFERDLIDGVFLAPAAVREYQVNPVRGQVIAILEDTVSTIVTFDLDSRQRINAWNAPGRLVPTMALSPDGQRIAVAGRVPCALPGFRGKTPAQVWVQDAATGRMIASMGLAHEDNPMLAWTGQNSVASTARQGESGAATCGGGGDDGRDVEPLVVWDAATGAKGVAPKGSFSSPQDLAASPDGRFLAMVSAEPGSKSRLTLWDGTEVAHVWEVDDGNFISLAFSADGRHLTTIRDRHPGALKALEDENAGTGRVVAALVTAYAVGFHADILRIDLPAPAAAPQNK